jgi:protein SCO1/2
VNRRRAAHFAGVLAFWLAAGVAGANAAQFQGVDVTGQGYGAPFKLTAQDGKPRNLASFRGQVLVLSFGFTQCPDVCPTTLAELAGVRRQLGDGAHDLQVAFITVDPERDTPALLGRYVTAFDPTFVGLSGDAQATRAVARGFRVFYQKIPQAHGYTMDHSTGYYVLDRKSRVRLFFPYGLPARAMASDLALLLQEK